MRPSTMATTCLNGCWTQQTARINIIVLDRSSSSGSSQGARRVVGDRYVD